VIIAIYALGYLLVNIGIIDSYLELNLVLIGINIILAAGLNLITGFTGQFSLGHAGFMAVGAYIAAVVTANFGQSFPAALLCSAIGAAIAGLIVGIPTLRLRGDYLAIATLGFGEIIRILLINTDYVGGAGGFNDIPRYTSLTWVYFIVVLSILLIKNFINSSHGRACMAVRDDEIAAEATGINPTYYKVMAFVIGALLAGIAGALYANYFYFIGPDSFGFLKSIDILIIVVFGGLGSITGSVAGAIAISVISLMLQSVPELRMVIYAVILFLIMVYRPQGLLGSREFSAARLWRREQSYGSFRNK
jgi:branched-chain amino acid transport system permease protein